MSAIDRKELHANIVKRNASLVGFLGGSIGTLTYYYSGIGDLMVDLSASFGFEKALNSYAGSYAEDLANLTKTFRPVISLGYSLLAGVATGELGERAYLLGDRLGQNNSFKAKAYDIAMGLQRLRVFPT